MLDITELKNDTINILKIDEKLEFSDEILQNTEIKKLENIKAVGELTRIENSTYHLTLNITGNMILLCARSLEEVTYPINIFIDKNITEEVQDEENQVIFQNSLDIFGIVWENIVLEVPLRVIKEDASFLESGDGWSLVSDKNKTNNSPFSDLLDMLDMEGKE